MATTKAKKQVQHRYSGEASKEFWDIVNSIESQYKHNEIYSLGVVLQNLEETVLRRLEILKPNSVIPKK